MEGINLGTNNGLLYLDSKIRFADISDGSSSTLLIGERPPSSDEQYGWTYVGAGQLGSGSADSVLGVIELNVYSNPDVRNCFHGPYTFGEGKFDNICDAFHFWSPHGGGANFAFADGSVRFLPYSAEPIMPALASRAGGDVVGEY